MRAFLDTNILVYLFDDDAPVKKATAQHLLQGLDSDGQAILSTQVLQEFYVSVTGKLAQPVPSEEAETAVRALMALPIVQVDPEMILGAVARSRSARLSLWDALILEAALAGGATLLYSEDFQHGQAIDGLRIENPFEGPPQ
ncbi:MAG: PIN domain-containing protein [Gemmatimonadota bacterium]